MGMDVRGAYSIKILSQQNKDHGDVE